MKKKQISVIRIDWIDSMQSGGWRHFRKSKMDCVTIGILYRELSDRYVIAQNWSRHGCGDYIEIPKISVTKIRRMVLKQ